MKKIYIIILVMALFVSACASTAQPTPIPTISLDNNGSNSDTPASDADSVAASAILVPIRTADLSFPSVGRVKAVNVQVGEQVTAGKILVELDTTLLEAKVREAEANLTVAQVQVNYLKRVGTDVVHLESAQAESDRA